MAERPAATGVSGLDDVLRGGFLPGHSYLLEGTGKTAIALKFLFRGAADGEPGLYITLSETETELRAGAASHGWSLGDGVDVFELVPPESLLGADLAREIARRWPTLPVILATGYAELPSGEMAELPRLSKPFDQAALSQMIGSVVR